MGNEGAGSRLCYSYEPLTDPATQFRLITFLPQTTATRGEDILSISLSTWQLDKAPPYVAVSYAWGAGQLAATLSVDGRVMHVRQNCFDVLRRLASESSEPGQRGDNSTDTCKHVWIDAVCIDQCNALQKGAQVQVMTTIYSSAAYVAVWLGMQEREEYNFLKKQMNAQMSFLRKQVNRLGYRILRDPEPGSGKAPDADTRAYTDEPIGRAFTHRSDVYKWQDEDIVKFLADLPDFRIEAATRCKWYEWYPNIAKSTQSRIQSALLTLASNPYWQRLWIVQEILRAPRVEVLWGGRSMVAWSVLSVFCRDVCTHILDTDLFAIEKSPPKGTSLASSTTDEVQMLVGCDGATPDVADTATSTPKRLDESDLAQDITRDMIRDSPMYRLMTWVHGYSNPHVVGLHASLRECLAATEDCLSSNPLDKVYGIMGLVDWQPHAGRLTPDYTLTPVQLAMVLLSYFDPPEPQYHMGHSLIFKPPVEWTYDMFEMFISQILRSLRLEDDTADLLTLWHSRKLRYIGSVNEEIVATAHSKRETLSVDGAMLDEKTSSATLRLPDVEALLHDDSRLVRYTTHYNDCHAISIDATGLIFVQRGVCNLLPHELAITEARVAQFTSQYITPNGIAPPRIISAVNGTMGGLCCSEAQEGDSVILYPDLSPIGSGYGLVLRSREPAVDGVLPVEGSVFSIVGQAVLFRPICHAPLRFRNICDCGSPGALDGSADLPDHRSPLRADNAEEETDLPESIHTSNVLQGATTRTTRSGGPEVHDQSRLETTAEDYSQIVADRPLRSSGSLLDAVATFTIVWDIEDALVFHWRCREAFGNFHGDPATDVRELTSRIEGLANRSVDSIQTFAKVRLDAVITSATRAHLSSYATLHRVDLELTALRSKAVPGELDKLADPDRGAHEVADDSDRSTMCSESDLFSVRDIDAARARENLSWRNETASSLYTTLCPSATRSRSL